jgi:hypothetical protein
VITGVHAIIYSRDPDADRRGDEMRAGLGPRGLGAMGL